MLVQSILMTLHIYWAQAFIIPKSVILEIENLCRTYLWGGTSEKRAPVLMAWKEVCLPKHMGGLGLKQLGIRKSAALGKQVWDIARKKDQLWVRWIAAVYLRGEDFMEVQPKTADIWHWKQLLKVRNLLRDGLLTNDWVGIVNGEYSIAKTYDWLIGERSPFRYANVVWHRYNVPKHAFISWLVLHRRLLTLDRVKN